jgi:hypothetical protein
MIAWTFHLAQTSPRIVRIRVIQLHIGFRLHDAGVDSSPYERNSTPGTAATRRGL